MFRREGKSNPGGYHLFHTPWLDYLHEPNIWTNAQKFWKILNIGRSSPPQEKIGFNK